MIEILKCKDGNNTMKINGVLQHSRYDVKKEANNFYKQNIENFKGNKLIIIGLGLGYHVLETLKNIDDSVRIKVFEYNKEVYKFAKHYGVLDEILKFSNVEIIINDILSSFAKELEKNDDVILYKASIKALKDEKLKNILMDFDVSRKAILSGNDLLKENYVANKKTNYKYIDEFIANFKSEKILVLTAGPSLDYEIENIKKYSKDITIICVGSALRTLMKNKIKPDAVVIIDGQEVVKDQIRDFENKNIALLFLNTASRWAVESFNGSKYMFFNEKREESTFSITTGGTVGLAALSIAKECEAKKIIMIGQDLAVINKKTHTISFEETYNVINSVDKARYNKFVEGINGEKLYTDLTYLYFKRKIESFISLNKHIKFINCGRGAKIEGTLNKEFIEAIKL